ncbi:MAG: glycosyltransferase family 2 protein [Syntrophales bacterium LBB04]|nr:glycosyltransferase family 2 protein [Syntrophales bacterium LBB04]
MPPKIYVVILHWKNILCLAECLASLDKVTYDNIEVIIVNNGPDDLSDINKHLKLKVQTLKSPSNVGFARGNNLGIKEALKNRADYVLLLNDDTVVFPDFLSILVGAGESNPDAGMLGPKIFYFDEPGKIWFSGSSFDTRTCMITTHGSDQIDEDDSFEPVISDYITGCALLIKKAVIEKIGLLDESFFLYWEDVDWGLRAKKAGLKNFVVPHSRIWHKVSVSTGGMDSPIRAYHKTRSHLLMAKLHSPKAMTRLQMGFFRDIAWLLVKSSDIYRVLRARAYMSAIIDYHLGRTDRGPQWLWND